MRTSAKCALLPINFLWEEVRTSLKCALRVDLLVEWDWPFVCVCVQPCGSMCMYACVRESVRRVKKGWSLAYLHADVGFILSLSSHYPSFLRGLVLFGGFL